MKLRNDWMPFIAPGIMFRKQDYIQVCRVITSTDNFMAICYEMKVMKEDQEMRNQINLVNTWYPDFRLIVLAESLNEWPHSTWRGMSCAWSESIISVHSIYPVPHLDCLNHDDGSLQEISAATGAKVSE